MRILNADKKIFSGRGIWESMWQEICKHIAEGARAKTLRQKDWILTELWKANKLHRRSNL